MTALRTLHNDTRVRSAWALFLSVCGYLSSQPALCDTVYGFVYQVSGNTVCIENIHGRYEVTLAGIVLPEFGQDYVEDAWPYIADDIVRKTVRVEHPGLDDTGTQIVGDVYLGNRWINRELVEKALALYYQANPRNVPSGPTSEPRLGQHGVWKWWYFLSRKSPVKFHPLRPSKRSEAQAEAAEAEKKKPAADKQQEKLRGIDSVRVTVSELPDYFSREGFSAEQLRLDVESQLRRYGLTIGSDANLHIVVKLLPYQKVDTYLSVEIRLFRGRSSRGSADSVWDISSFSYLGKAGGRTIDENISNKIQIFVGDYLAVN